MGKIRSFYRGADKSLARLGRKQANVSVRMTRISFGALPCRKKKTWWQLASRCRWNRARPWHASELVSFLVGLTTYQHPGNIKAVGTCSNHCIGVKKHLALSLPHVTLSHCRIISYYHILQWYGKWIVGGGGKVMYLDCVTVVTDWQTVGCCYRHIWWRPDM